MLLMLKNRRNVPILNVQIYNALSPSSINLGHEFAQLRDM